MARMIREHISSYRDLPRYTYQFQTKFRNELRAKSGIMRGREFLMKDMYSFTKDQADLDAFYEQSIQAYKNVYDRVGIGDKTYLTFASGGMFSKFSHEFQTICEAGEDYVYIDKEKNIAVNDEVMEDEILKGLGIERANLEKVKSIEVGNIFKYGERYSKPLGLTYKDEAGNDQPVIMGAYGIGIGRVMGTVVELLSDDRGLVWPESIAPYRVHLIAIPGKENNDVLTYAENIYEDLRKAGIEVLYDDREGKSAGEKFADSDLLGLPYRIVISGKTLAEESVEIKKRTEDEAHMIPLAQVIDYVS